MKLVNDRLWKGVKRLRNFLLVYLQE